MLLEELFLNTDTVEVWPTFERSILARLDRAWRSSDEELLAQVVSKDTYDNYFRQQHGIVGYVPLNTAVNLLRVQIDGRPGPLLVQGEQNVFYLKTCDVGTFGTDGIVLQAQWLPNYRNVHRWLVLGWEMTPTTSWPNWGSHRPQGSKIFW